MSDGYKKKLLMGASIMIVSVYSNTVSVDAFAQAMCDGVQTRAIQCRDFRDNVVADSFCDQIGVTPTTTRGCQAPCPPPSPPGDDPLMRGDGGGDPLIFDMDGNGVSLTSCEDGVMFDIDNDGVKDRTSWTDGRDGILTLDDNGNGTIDRQSELFGNSKDAAYKDLANYDSNGDGILNRRDTIWDDLKMWVDSNRDGISQEDELKTLREIGMTKIDLDYDTVEEVNAGNAVTAKGSFERILDNGKKFVSEVIETFFNFISG